LLSGFIGAAIGIGFFFKSAAPFYFGGPIFFCLSYILIGTVAYAVLVRSIHLKAYRHITLGEMVSYLPLPGGWFTLANRTLNPSFVFFFADTSNYGRALPLDGYIG
jgi:yeast amino acid transporter